MRRILHFRWIKGVLLLRRGKRSRFSCWVIKLETCQLYLPPPGPPHNQTGNLYICKETTIDKDRHYNQLISRNLDFKRNLGSYSTHTAGFDFKRKLDSYSTHGLISRGSWVHTVHILQGLISRRSWVHTVHILQGLISITKYYMI